ncbi:Glu/Leu/Phe/Val family dehydrogenase [Egicoccus halophilus]|uniref:Valine dehydrogenase n=1 Tax=Egicoccus halophilus TaxID=1670830 RepID=A0A8J3ESB0_9ACTN|nr:Glu/Leu/Phe/Val dehydrogenase dimerization domain-containing protein [Egicoccus halophilus]GGI02606.1 valine dehydrogenase [Egicoccus halophilus]
MEGPFARFQGHEQVVFGNDEETGLRCIVAMHSTKLGPALGGTRFYPYDSEDEALTDVLRLSRAMSYKAACAGLDLGGGKAVIIGDPAELRTEALLRAYGRVIESLGGRYVTACDVGTTPADMAVVRRETRWATGAEEVHGGSGDSGVLTAYGVYLGMKAAAQAAFGTDALGGRHVAVQGLGKVGARLVGHLVDEGAKVTAADVSTAACEKVASLPGVEIVDVEDVLLVDADIVSPNALGAVLDAGTIPQLQARVVCGGANNQLATEEDGDHLADRGVLYAPDFVVNAGGLINVSDELEPGGYSAARAHQRADAIPATLHEIIAESRTQGVSTERAAITVAERRMASVGGLRRIWLP